MKLKTTPAQSMDQHAETIDWILSGYVQEGDNAAADRLNDLVARIYNLAFIEGTRAADYEAETRIAKLMHTYVTKRDEYDNEDSMGRRMLLEDQYLSALEEAEKEAKKYE